LAARHGFSAEIAVLQELFDGALKKAQAKIKGTF